LDSTANFVSQKLIPREKKKEEKEKKETRIDHTELKEKGAKTLCYVPVFICKAFQ